MSAGAVLTLLTLPQFTLPWLCVSDAKVNYDKESGHIKEYIKGGVNSMKKLLAWLTLLLTLLAPRAFAGEYVYFRGYADLKSFQDGESVGIVTWDITTNQCTALSLEGVLIEKDADEVGCLLLPTGQTGEELRIVRLMNGEAREEFSIPIPQNWIQIYAYKRGWVYYSSVDGIQRINAEGEIDAYNVPPEAQCIRISDDGKLAFTAYADKNDGKNVLSMFSPPALYLALPNEIAHVIVQPERRSPNCVWLNNETLLYWNDDDRLIALNLATNETALYMEESANGQFYVSANGKRILSVEPASMLGEDRFSQLRLFSIDTQQTEYSPLILCGCEFEEQNLCIQIEG